MKDIDLKNAFPPVPSAVHARIEEAIRETDNMDRRKARRPIAVAALVMAILLALASVAYAVTQTGVLKYLIKGSGELPDNLAQSIQAVNRSKTDDNIKISITDAVFDGSCITLSYTAENLNPTELAQVWLDKLVVNGAEIGMINNFMNDLWTPMVFCPEKYKRIMNPLEGGVVGNTISAKPGDMLHCEATFTVRRPMNDRLMVVDPMMWTDNEPLGDRDALDRLSEKERSRLSIGEYMLYYGTEIRSGAEMREMLAPYHISVANYNLHDTNHWTKLGFTVVDMFGIIQDSIWIEDSAPSEDYKRTMKTTAEIKLSFDLRVPPTAEKISVALPNPVELEDCTVSFDEITISPLSTIIRLSIYPVDKTIEAAREIENRYRFMSLKAPYGWYQSGTKLGRRVINNDPQNPYFMLSFIYPGARGDLNELRFSAPKSYKKDGSPYKEYVEAFEEKVVIKLHE